MPVFQYATFDMVRFNKGTLELSGRVFFQVGGVGQKMPFFCVSPASTGVPSLTVDLVPAMQTIADHLEEMFANGAYYPDQHPVVE